MTASDAELIRALVGLAEVLEHVNARARRDGEIRAGIAPVSPAAAAVAAFLLRHSSQTVTAIREGVLQDEATVQRALADLARSGMVSREGDGRGATYSTTPKNVDVRERVRERAASSFRYALAPLAPHSRAALAAGADAITELARSLGYSDVADPGSHALRTDR